MDRCKTGRMVNRLDGWMQDRTDTKQVVWMDEDRTDAIQFGCMEAREDVCKIGSFAEPVLFGRSRCKGPAPP